MKNILRLFSLVAFVACAAISCNKELVEQPLLELDRSHMKMTIGQSQKLNATVKGVEAELVWESSDTEVASVAVDGTVTAVATGTTKVVVSAAGMSKECEIVVVDFTAAKLELNKEFTQTDPKAAKYTHMILKGEQLQISPRFYNSDDERVDEMAYPKYKVILSEPSKFGVDVITVNDEGLVEALNPGSAVVRVSGAGKDAEVTVTVKSIELNQNALSMYVNESVALVASVLPESLNESEKKVEWLSGAPEYVEVNSGIVTALKPTLEPVVVTARCGGLSADCMISITDYEISNIQLTRLDGLMAGDGKYQMLVGDTPYSLGVRFEKDGEDVTEMVTKLSLQVVYTSSDNEVAIVEKGIITVKKAGKTEIKVSCAGKETSFNLVVIQCVESVRIIEPSSNPYVINEKNDSFNIVCEVYPENASVKTVTFMSTMPDIASVDENGLVTIHKAGEAQIVVTTDGFKRPYVGNDGATIVEPAVVNLILVVSDEATKPTALSISGDGVEDGVVTIQKGNKLQLRPVVTPTNYSGNYTWSTTTPDVLSIDENGLLTALVPGEGKVILVAEGAVAELTVNVTGVNPTSIKINEEGGTKPVTIGKIALSASMTAPENGDFAGVNWYSSDENVATVAADGVVTVLKQGEVTITAKAKSLDGTELSDVTASVGFFFVAPAITGVNINLTKTVVEVGETLQLLARAIPLEAELPNQTWSILDGEGNIKLTESGLLTAIKAEKVINESGFGDWKKATVKVTVKVGEAELEATAEIQIIPTQPTDILLDLPEGNTLRVGQEWRFNPRVLPEGLGYHVVCNASLPGGKPNNDAYSVFVPDAPGELKGTFAVSGTDGNLVYDYIRKEVYIIVKPYYVETIELPEVSDVEVGGSFIITPEFTSDVEGYQPTYTNVTWTSSDKTKATVDVYGRVTALAAGTVEITATTSHEYSVPGGQPQKSATCTINIKEPERAINVGDYYYSDGTWSSELNTSKTVIGVVFARANSASTDALLAKDYPGCVHGLVLGLEEYEKSCITDRSWLRADLISWMSQNGYNQWLVNDKYCGYNNTQGLIALNSANVQSNGDIIHVNHVDAVIEHRQKVQTPSGASAWSLPSYLEIKELSTNLDVVNASLEKVAGTTLRRTYEYVYDRQTGGAPIPTVGTADQHYYYSNNVTENATNAYNMNTDNLVTPKVSTTPWDSVSGEGTPLPVRVVLAF